MFLEYLSIKSAGYAFLVVMVSVAFAQMGFVSLPGITPSNPVDLTPPEYNSSEGGEIQTASATATSTPTPTPEPPLESSGIEMLIHAEINRVRADNGLPELEYDTQLAEVARYHSEDMAQNNYFSHDSPGGEGMEDRYEAFGYECRVPAGGNSYYAGAENILTTYYQTPLTNGNHYNTPSELASGVVSGWMDSPGHRQNIVTPEWKKEGIGVYIDGDRVYVTQNFC